MATAHTLKQFDQDLSALRDLVLRMGGTAEEQVRGALRALEQGTVAAAREIARRDRDIDRMELRADEEVAQLLALRAPLGVDLRTVLMLSKTVTDLERVGDEAKKIAKVAVRVHEAVSGPREVPLLEQASALGQRALSMLRGALDALVRLDLARADALDAEEKALDTAYKGALAELQAWMVAHPQGIALAVQVMFAMKGLERIGDHARNIAQYLHYLVEGRDVRHPRANPATPR